MKSHFLEGIRFIIIGLVAVAIDFVVYFALLKFTSIPTSSSKAISFMSGAMFSFVGHRFFVFHSTDKVARKQALPFVLLYLISLLLNNFTNEIIITLSGIKLIAWFISTAISVIWNYLGMKFVVFRPKLPNPSFINDKTL